MSAEGRHDERCPRDPVGLKPGQPHSRLHQSSDQKKGHHSLRHMSTRDTTAPHSGVRPVHLKGRRRQEHEHILRIKEIEEAPAPINQSSNSKTSAPSSASILPRKTNLKREREKNNHPDTGGSLRRMDYLKMAMTVRNELRFEHTPAPRGGPPNGKPHHSQIRSPPGNRASAERISEDD